MLQKVRGFLWGGWKEKQTQQCCIWWPLLLPGDPVGEGDLFLTPDEVGGVVHGTVDGDDVDSTTHLAAEVIARVGVVVDAVGQLKQQQR